MRHHSRLFVAIILMGAICPAAASAAELGKDSKELNLSVLLQDTDGAGFYLNVASRFGYLVTANHELGPIVSALYVRPDSGGTIKAASLGAFYRYNFSTTNAMVLPFFGIAAVGYVGDLRDTLDWGWQAEGGIRLMPTPAASVNTTVFWKRDYTLSQWVTDERAFGVTVGFSIFF